MPVTPHSSYRLSAEAKKLLSRVGVFYGLSNTSILEWIIREKAREIPDKPKPKKRR